MILALVITAIVGLVISALLHNYLDDGIVAQKLDQLIERTSSMYRDLTTRSKKHEHYFGGNRPR